MKKKPVSEQLIGYAWVGILLIGLIVFFVVINKKDNAGEQNRAQRERVRFVQDSIQTSIEEKERQRAEWALQKAEREQKHAEWEKKHQNWERKKKAEDNILIELHPFDPNLADSSELVHLGLRPWMARSVEHYREKGGKFRKPEDFRKTYGMTDSLYSSLEPYIVISDSFRIDTIARPHYVSNKRDTIIELNTADTASLQMIRGIGPYTAVQIVRLRDKLGGFYNVDQIRELDIIKDADGIIAHLTVDSTKIKRLPINHMSVEALGKHKYIRFEQAKAIRDYRHKKGPIHNIEKLKELKVNGEKAFSDDDLQRLQPYLSFEE